ncbi:Apoptosis inhibitor 5-like protein API5 [Diplonema papillatum]|nr:Apoptosis inhibitor 5-like protein API5 [Diplonema papillatum]
MAVDFVDKVAGLQERLYNSETQTKEWSAEDYKGVLEIMSTKDAPKMILVRCMDMAAKYGKHFPDLVQEGFERLLSFADSGEATLKTQALKHLDTFLKPSEGASAAPVISKHAPELLQKKFEALDNETPASKFAAELLAKMTVADPKTVAVACSAALQAETATNEAWRDFVLKHLTSEVLTKQKAQLAASKDAELTVKDEINKLLHVACKKEFDALFSALTGLKIASDKEAFGLQGCVDVLSSLIDTNAEVDLGTEWQVERTLSIIQNTVPLLGKNKHSEDKVFTQYLINKWVSPTNVFSKASDAHRMQILQCLCDVSPHCTEAVAKECLPPMYELLCRYLPEKPKEGDAPPADLNFTVVECLLYSLYALGKKAPDSFAEVTGIKAKLTLDEAKKAAATVVKTKEDIDREKPFKDRLSSAHDATAKMQVQLASAKAKLAADKSGSAEIKARLETITKALNNLQNVVALASAVKGAHPHFPDVHLPWQPRAGQKRKADAGESAPKRQKTESSGKPSGKGAGKGGKKGGKGGKRGGGRWH